MRNLSKNTKKRIDKILLTSVNLPEWVVEIDWLLKRRAAKKQFKMHYAGLKKTTIYK